MLALAKKTAHPVAGWAEPKLDGVRCYWDHIKHQAVSRSGKRLPRVEPWLQVTFPHLSVDGELFVPGGNHDTAWAAMHSEPETLRYGIFDLLAAFDLNTRPFALSARRAALGSSPMPDRCLLVPGRQVDEAGCLEELIAITGGGGEGLVIKDLFAPYRAGLDSGWLKLKPHYLVG